MIERDPMSLMSLARNYQLCTDPTLALVRLTATAPTYCLICCIRSAKARPVRSSTNRLNNQKVPSTHALLAPTCAFRTVKNTLNARIALMPPPLSLQGRHYSNINFDCGVRPIVSSAIDTTDRPHRSKCVAPWPSLAFAWVGTNMHETAPLGLKGPVYRNRCLTNPVPAPTI